MRLSGRGLDEIRKIEVEPNISLYAEGSCLIMFGNTQIICSATVDKHIPPFLKGKGQGWLTAEYGMLPRSTNQRMRRDINLGKINGRSQEIQRLIGRSLRACINFELLGEKQIIIDCDVINADGGTRTASITGGYIALHLAIMHLLKEKELKVNPIRQQIAAISCGIVGGRVMVDLDYMEDSNADVDANFVLGSDGTIIEIQGSSEKKPFTETQFNTMLSLAQKAMPTLIKRQNETLNNNS